MARSKLVVVGATGQIAVAGTAEGGGGGGGGGGVDSVVAGDGISVNSVDPANPIVSVTGDVLRDADVGVQVQAFSAVLAAYAANPLMETHWRTWGLV